jgi:hypothetical protein
MAYADKQIDLANSRDDRRALGGSFALRYPTVRSSHVRFFGRWRFALLGGGFALLMAAWIAATAPFAAPDEASHYLRALTIADGQLLGMKVLYGPDPALTPTQQEFINHDTRAVRVPARLSPPDVNCMNANGITAFPVGKPDLAGSCLEATPSGNFPPLGYLLPAVALGASHDATAGLWLGRVASALQSLAFLLLALALLWDGSGWSTLGLLAAVSPMVLFASSVLNPSGIEITSSLAFAAAALRITRLPSETSRWVWIAFAVSGAVTILSGPIGVAFGLAVLALFGALLGRRGLRELHGRTGRWLRLSALTLLGAGILALVYSRIAGFSSSFGFSPFGHSLALR